MASSISAWMISSSLWQSDTCAVKERKRRRRSAVLTPVLLRFVHYNQINHFWFHLQSGCSGKSRGPTHTHTHTSTDLTHPADMDPTLSGLFNTFPYGMRGGAERFPRQGAALLTRIYSCCPDRTLFELDRPLGTSDCICQLCKHQTRSVPVHPASLSWHQHKRSLIFHTTLLGGPERFTQPRFCHTLVSILVYCTCP